MKTIFILIVIACLIAFKIGQNEQEKQYTPSEVLEVYFPDNILYADFLTKQVYFETTDDIHNFKTHAEMVKFISVYSAKKCNSIPTINKVWL